AVTVNTAAGGTGNATIDNVSAVGGAASKLTVNSNGGSNLYAGAGKPNTAPPGPPNRRGAPPPTPPAGGGHLPRPPPPARRPPLRPLQPTAPSGSATVTAAGPGGIYVTDWGANALNVLSATATGAGGIRIVTANGSGHNLTVSGNVSTASGNIYLAADDAVTV